MEAFEGAASTRKQVRAEGAVHRQRAGTRGARTIVVKRAQVKAPNRVVHLAVVLELRTHQCDDGESEHHPRGCDLNQVDLFTKFICFSFSTKSQALVLRSSTGGMGKDTHGTGRGARVEC